MNYRGLGTKHTIPLAQQICRLYHKLGLGALPLANYSFLLPLTPSLPLAVALSLRSRVRIIYGERNASKIHRGTVAQARSPLISVVKRIPYTHGRGKTRFDRRANNAGHPPLIRKLDLPINYLWK